MSRERTMTQCGCAVVVMHPDRVAGFTRDTSRKQEELARAAAGLEVLVGAPRLLQRGAAADPPLQRAAGAPAEPLARAPLELLARGRVGRQAGAREVERLRLQALRVVCGS